MKSHPLLRCWILMAKDAKPKPLTLKAFFVLSSQFHLKKQMLANHSFSVLRKLL